MWRILVMVCVLAACSPAPRNKTAEEAPIVSAPIVANDTILDPAAPWTCADGQALTITIYGDPDRAEIERPGGGKVVLYAAAAASGTLYQDATHSFHSKGDEALLTFGDATTMCRKTPEPQ